MRAPKGGWLPYNPTRYKPDSVTERRERDYGSRVAAAIRSRQSDPEAERVLGWLKGTR